MTTRLAIIASHPIQYHAPMYRQLACEPGIELRVFFASRIGLETYYDPGMNETFAWKSDLLAGYESTFLPGAENVKQIGFSKLNSPGLGAALDAFGPDAVMFYGYAQINFFRVLHWTGKHGVPLLFQGDSELAHQRSGWRRLVKQAVIPRLFRRIDAFLAVGSRNVDYYRHYGVPADRIFDSPFAIDAVAFERDEGTRDRDRVALRERLGLSATAVIALFAGKLGAHKRPGDILKAAAHARKHHGVGCELVFAGNGTLIDELKAAARDLDVAAHFLGFVNLDELPAVFAGADFLILPSEIEPFGLVCTEAICVGLPLVVSNRVGAAGPTDVARDGDNAIVYPCGDIDVLADAITMLSTDPARRERMARRSREIFETLDVRKSIGGIRDALAAVASRRRR